MKDFTPTKGQAEALAAIRSMDTRFPNGGGVAVISGPGGTGKTSLLKVLAEEDSDLFVLTPTGKAAVRVKEAAGCRAMTIHKWQYKVRVDEKTGLVDFFAKDHQDLELPSNNTIIVDEASMVSKSIWSYLYSFCKLLNLNVVLIGDGYQLPPVERESKEVFSVFADSFKADIKVNLTEVLRQALESPIIRVITDIRTLPDIGQALTQLRPIMAKNLDQELVQNHKFGGITICHRNVTRHSVNSRIRASMGLPSDMLQPDEPLLVLKNHYALEVYNGEVYTVDSLGKKIGPIAVTDRHKNASQFLSFQEVFLKSCKDMILISQDEIFGTVELGHEAISKASARAFGVEVKKSNHVHMNSGYALSIHKAQGSQWRSGIVIVESSFKLNTLEGRKLLYTALSRFQDSVKVVWMVD